jgi:CRP-like cAMP-binding protein
MHRDFLSENVFLRTDQVFDGLPKELDLLMQSSVTHHYKKGEIIFREGGIPTGIFHVVEGHVKKYKSTPNGGEQIFYLCRRGELLGYHALLGEENYPDSAATIEDAMIAFIPKDSFLQVLHNSPHLSNRLLKALGKEFSLFINSIANLATKTVRERLAIQLLQLDEKFKKSNHAGAASEINISRADLANMVGTAKETIVRTLHDFETEGLIEKTDKMIKILNRKGIIKKANLIGLGSRNKLIYS